MSDCSLCCRLRKSRKRHDEPRRSCGVFHALMGTIGGMSSRRHSLWPVFWTTAVFIIAMNIALAVYVANIPYTPTMRGEMARDIPPWAQTAFFALNFPFMPFYFLFGESLGFRGLIWNQPPVWVAVSSTFSATMWGALAIVIRRSRLRDRPGGPQP